jgi:hypothetical protein
MGPIAKALYSLRWRLAAAPVILACSLAGSLPAADQAPPPGKAALSADEARQGFVPIFDGRTLNGWQGAVDGHEVVDGLLVCKKTCGGKLFTDKEYGDFIFRFEFKLEPGGNNGISIRGYESQILDDDAPVYANLKPYSYHGSIIRCQVAAKRGHLKPPGQWNAQEIECRGSHWKITLNGAVIVDVDLAKVPAEEAPALAKQTKGRIGLLGHHSRVEFRNLRVKEL